MADYVIGDVQGCHAALLALLEHVGFDRRRDRALFAGDLVNRGPASLDVLRFVRGLGDAADAVLGNHDLHLLASIHGTRGRKRSDTFDAILAAPDRDGLVDWLRHRPVAIEVDDALIVHAGLAPAWAAGHAVRLARELEATIRGERCGAFLEAMYGNEPAAWDDGLVGHDRLRCLTNFFTRVRYVDAAGAMDHVHSGPPGTQADGLIPWFAHPQRRSRDTRVLFGHWATLRLDGDPTDGHRVRHLDTGCVWGGRLTAVRLGDGREFSVPCPGAGDRG